MVVKLRCYKHSNPLMTAIEKDGVVVCCAVMRNDLCPKPHNKLVFEVNCIAESDR